MLVMNAEYKYKRASLPPMYYRDPNGLCKWFEDEHKNGWELVTVDYTTVNNGYFDNKYICYIFRKLVELGLPYETV